MSTKYFGSSDGLTIVSSAGQTRITSEYNTGIMPADIKGCLLSSTAITSLVGTVIIDDTFTGTGNLDGWTLSSGAVDNAGVDYLDVTSSGVSNDIAAKTISGLTVGQQYVVEFERKAGTEIVAMFTGLYSSEYSLVVGVSFFLFTATATTQELSIRVGGVSEVAKLDNISCRVADEDRSVNNNGIGVHGTIVRAEVATGAELVAYSGFSVSDYLKQPYNTDFNVGVGDFHVACWLLSTQATTSSHAIDWGDGVSSGIDRFVLYVAAGALYFSGGNVSITLESSTPLNTWRHVVVTRTGGTMYGYINGVEVATAANSVDMTNASAFLTVGRRHTGTEPFTGSLTLIRIGAGAPSAEQIAKMYEDEKHLFQPNAACTLAGSSDAVTALSCDQDIDFLHVTQSDIRSVFKGLHRIYTEDDTFSVAVDVSGGVVLGK